MLKGTSKKKHYKKDSWRRRALKSRNHFDPEYKMEAEKHPTEEDVVLKHTENGANIRITDGGTIKLFADDDTGIVIDPDSSSIQIHSKRFKSMTEEFHVQSDSDKFMWNYMPLNSALQDPFTELMTANCVPMPIPFDSGTIMSGTEIFKEILTNPATHRVGIAPTEPLTANLIDTPAVGLEGKRAYKGIKQLNMLKKAAEGIKEMVT